MKMTKTQYEAIAKPFAEKTNWTQYLYCIQGFDNYGTSKHVHSQRGHEFYTYFKDLDSIVFNIANNLKDLNEKFDREKFFQACGMQSDGISYWSFVPTQETIKKVRH